MALEKVSLFRNRSMMISLVSFIACFPIGRSFMFINKTPLLSRFTVAPFNLLRVCLCACVCVLESALLSSIPVWMCVSLAYLHIPSPAVHVNTWVCLCAYVRVQACIYIYHECVCRLICLLNILHPCIECVHVHISVHNESVGSRSRGFFSPVSDPVIDTVCQVWNAQYQ